MTALLVTSPQEIRIPEAIVLPDGRKRLTRYWRLSHTGTLPPQINLAWGTLDKGTAPAGWTGLRLTNRKIYDTHRFIKDDDKHGIIELVYEQIDESGETRVGEDDTTFLEDGRKAIVQEYLQFTTGTYAPQTVGSSHTPGYLQKEEAPDDGTLRRIKRTYVAAGLLSQTDETKNGGKLLIRSITEAVTVPSTPSGYALVDVKQQNPGGYPVYIYTFAKGSGLVIERIRSRQDGLREMTHIALGTRDAPAGIVIEDDYSEEDGYKMYTVTTMQTATGSSDVTGATLHVQRRVPFTYPGRAKAYTKTAGGNTFIDVFLSPPIESEVTADVDISYQTSGDIGSLAHDFWEPEEWATIEAYWVGPYGYPALHVEALRGYRSVDETAVTATASIIDVGTDTACMGKPVYGGTTAQVQVFGGPDDPGGTTFILHADTELAFTGTDGTKYYRLTLISAAIPTQPDLPI